MGDGVFGIVGDVLSKYRIKSISGHYCVKRGR